MTTMPSSQSVVPLTSGQSVRVDAAQIATKHDGHDATNRLMAEMEERMERRIAECERRAEGRAREIAREEVAARIVPRSVASERATRGDDDDGSDRRDEIAKGARDRPRDDDRGKIRREGISSGGEDEGGEEARVGARAAAAAAVDKNKRRAALGRNPLAVARLVVAGACAAAFGSRAGPNRGPAGRGPTSGARPTGGRRAPVAAGRVVGPRSLAGRSSSSDPYPWEGDVVAVRTACLTLEECRTRSEWMGASGFFSGGTYPAGGCFLKNGNVFFSPGTTEEMSVGELPGRLERVWCDPPTAGPTGGPSSDPTSSIPPSTSLPPSPLPSVLPSPPPSPLHSTRPSASNPPTNSANPSSSNLPTKSSHPTTTPQPSMRPSSSALPSASIFPTISKSPSASPTFSVLPTRSSLPTNSPAPTPSPACKGADPRRCGCSGNNQADYRGTVNTTKVGVKCARWDAPWILERMSHADVLGTGANPLGGRRDSYAERYPDAGLEGNHCRNPNGRDRAWCWTEGTDADFDYCDVPYCFPPAESCSVLNPLVRSGNDELEDACAYMRCLGAGTTGSASEAALSDCLCPKEMWDCKFGSKVCEGDPVRRNANQCCVDSAQDSTLTTAAASCECSIRPDCDLKKNAQKCHVFGERCCAEDDGQCKCNYKKQACRLALEKDSPDAKVYCDEAEQACCDHGYGGCKCDFWEPLCHDFSNRNANCLKASRNCCGNRQCRCDFLTHAKAALGYADTSNREESNCARASNVRPDRSMEEESLRDIYRKTGGEHWFNNAGWLTKSNHCSWHGIKCDAKGFVSEVDLTRNNITGEFPADSLSKLYQLETLLLADNQLRGTMAGTNDRSIDEKRFLLISDTSVFFNLHQLHRVDLSRNELSGEVDVLFAPAVKHVNFSHNRFTSVNRFKKFKRSHSTLKVFDLSHNFIRQEASEIMEKVPPNIEQIFLSGNRIEGTLPETLEVLWNLRRLHLDSNALSGQLPDFSVPFPKLQELDLSNQKGGGNDGFTGNIRQSLSSLPRLTLLNLAGNNLTGAIPAVLGNLAVLKTMDLSNNELSQSIPAELGKLGGTLQVMNLSNNMLEGTIPPQIGKLNEIENTKLLLNGNAQVLDPAPLSVCFISGFDRKDDAKLCPPERNALKILFDSAKGGEWTVNTDWGHPYKSHCSWHGVECNDDNKTAKLILSSNGLSGTLSPDIAKLSFLEFLDLSDNDIKGSIPTEIGNLSRLTHLRLAYNSFVGNETNFGTNLQRLELVQLHGNRLSGSIPRTNVHFPQIYSFVADCGYPSDFDVAVECEDCTMCCNSQEDCYPTDDHSVQKVALQRVKLMNYSQLAGLFFACLFAACCLLGLAMYARNRSKNIDLQRSLIREPSVAIMDKKYAFHTIGEESVNQFLLSTSWLGWAIVLATMGMQIWMLFVFVRAAEATMSDSSDLVYTWKCPRDNYDCKNRSDLTSQGWIAFVIVMTAHLLKDVISGTKLIVLSAKERHSKHTRTRFFFGGWLLNTVTMFTLFVSIIYNQAIATSDTEIIMNAVVILFIIDIDEMFYDILMVINPDWVKTILKTKSYQRPEKKDGGEHESDVENCLRAGPRNETDRKFRMQDGAIQNLEGEVDSLRRVVLALQETVEKNEELIRLLKAPHNRQMFGWVTSWWPNSDAQDKAD